jgi:hypothetical protein
MSFTTIATKGFQTNLPNVMEGPNTIKKWMPHKQLELKNNAFQEVVDVWPNPLCNYLVLLMINKVICTFNFITFASN